MSELVQRLRAYIPGENQDEVADRIKEAADEIERLRAALRQFVAACENAPPTSLMIEIGMACKSAKAALAPPVESKSEVVG